MNVFSVSVLRDLKERKKERKKFEQIQFSVTEFPLFPLVNI